MRNRAAFSLMELATVLAIFATLAAVATPVLAHARRVLSVRAASTDLAGLLALTRAAALGHGGAALVLDAATGTAIIETADGAVIGDPYPIGERHGVIIEADRSSPVRIRYDALGIGRLAATSIRVRRGDVRTAVIVSSYGRVRL